MGWKDYTLEDDTMGIKPASTASRSRGGSIALKMHNDSKKQRVSECTLMLWGVVDLIAMVSYSVPSMRM